MSYKVLKGDTLSKIAKLHNMSLDELLQLNNISTDSANNINVGLEIKISKNNRPLLKSSTHSSFKKYIVNENSQNENTMSIPFKNDYSKTQYLKDNALKVLKILKDAGYNLGTSGQNKDGVDGNWGNKSQLAFDQALKDGYVFDNKTGNLYKQLKLASKSRSSTASYLYSVNPMFGTPINSPVSKETSVSAPNFSEIPVEQLKQIYKEGPGMGDAAGTMLFHVVSPENFSIPHTDGLKNQVAAAIAYNESLPQNKRERDANGIQTDDEGYQYVGYNTYGILSGQSGNVNNQGTEANAASKVMGGLRYRINEDGSINVKDRYSFNVVRDFDLTNSTGKPKVMSKEEKAQDKYAGKPWLGLWHDLTSKHSKIINDNATWRPSTWFDGKGLQDLAENVGTRQGKVRDNSFVFAPGEISKRLGL